MFGSGKRKKRCQRAGPEPVSCYVLREPSIHFVTSQRVSFPEQITHLACDRIEATTKELISIQQEVTVIKDGEGGHT